jgi:hypothetical protein
MRRTRPRLAIMTDKVGPDADGPRPEPP